MATDQLVKPEVLFTEAPASWNTSYVTPEGFTCRITLRGDNGKDLLDKANTALSFLIEHGYTPDINNHRNGKGEGKQCPIHRCWMKRYEKDGKTWHSHKLDDGSWCYGKQKGD